jgi:hypothetical protein
VRAIELFNRPFDRVIANLPDCGPPDSTPASFADLPIVKRASPEDNPLSVMQRT